MLKGFKVIALHFVIILLALEVRTFYQQGGPNNDLAFTLFKVNLLMMLALIITNFTRAKYMFMKAMEDLATPQMFRAMKEMKDLKANLQNRNEELSTPSKAGLSQHKF